MKSYSELALRVRFQRGFNPEAYKYMATTIACQWGKLGLASKPFPVNRNLLLSADILTSNAFASGREKDVWRSNRRRLDQTWRRLGLNLDCADTLAGSLLAASSGIGAGLARRCRRPLAPDAHG